MATYVVIAAAIVLVLTAVNRLGSRPAQYRDLDTPGLRSLLELLYVRGLDGGYLHVAVIGSSQFLRVYKYIRGPEEVVLKAHIPQVTYAPLGLERTQETLQAHGFAASIGGPGGAGNTDDLVVGCGPLISRSVVVTEFLLRDLLHLDPERQCVAHIERAHPNPWAHPGFAAAPRF